MLALKEIRESLNIEPEALALVLDLIPDLYDELEASPELLWEELDLGQWVRLAGELGLRLSDVFRKEGEEPRETKLSFQQIRDALGEAAHRIGGVDALEEALGWELRSFLKSPDDGWNRKLGFFKAAMGVLGGDWRDILRNYG